MAAGNTAKLIASLELQDKFSATVKKANAGIGKMEGRFDGLSRSAKKVGIGLAAAGVAAGIFVTAQIKNGIDSLVELEDATTQVDGAIEQMGLTGKVTSSQIADWANQIETSVQAAFDDKAIVAGTANLIRFGKVSEDNLRPAMVVMTDLAAKTGDVKTASELLGKALGDPAKAAGKLSRYGIVLTKVEQDQVKAFVKAGKTGKAQAIVLAAVEKQTKGAAAAAKGPYADSMNLLQDAVEDAQKALAIGFLPIIKEVADFLSTELAKPETIANIQEFGKGLAGGLKSLISTAKSLPWEKIASALKTGAEFAKGIIDAFLSAPDWLKAAVVGGWGLNKISGGLFGNLIGELGKGLIKGVLGMTAAVVNLKAATVTGIGGAGGVAGGAAGGSGLMGKIGTVVKVAGAVTIAGASIYALAQQIGIFTGQVGEAQGELRETVKGTSSQDVKTSLDNLNGTIGNLGNMNLFDKTIAITAGGTEITDNIVAAGARLAADASSVAELTASRTAIKAAVEFARTNALGDAVGPLKIELAAVNAKLLVATTKEAETARTTENLRAETVAIGSRSGALFTQLTSVARSGLNATSTASQVAAVASRDAANAIRTKQWKITIPVMVDNRITVRAITNGNAVNARYNGGARIYEGRG